MSFNQVGLESLGTRTSQITLRCPEFVITERPRPGEPLSAVFQRVAQQLQAREAVLLSVMIYGSLSARAEIDAALETALGKADWPVTWIEGASCGRLPIAGLQVFAVTGRPVTRIPLGGSIAASVYEDGGARHCLVGGIGPTALSLRPGAQTQQTFANLEWVLGIAGFSVGDVIRTWFYNEDILNWYDTFNHVRSEYYAGVKWRNGSIPASTAIGARNPSESALILAARALRPLDGRAHAQEVASPLQCPAPAYGSSFSRAMEIDCGLWRQLLVSGTASIAPDGKTAWPGDVSRQIDRTMAVIGAILDSRGMTFDDVTRATAYVKEPRFKAYFDAWCSMHDLGHLPVISMHNAVCRDDLLFELEVDACVSRCGSHLIADALLDRQ